MRAVCLKKEKKKKKKHERQRRGENMLTKSDL